MGYTFPKLKLDFSFSLFFYQMRRINFYHELVHNTLFKFANKSSVLSRKSFEQLANLTSIFYGNRTSMDMLVKWCSNIGRNLTRIVIFSRNDRFIVHFSTDSYNVSTMPKGMQS